LIEREREKEEETLVFNRIESLRVVYFDRKEEEEKEQTNMSRGKRPFAAMVLGSCEESIMKFMKLLPDNGRKRKDSVESLVTSDEGVNFKIVSFNS